MKDLGLWKPHLEPSCVLDLPLDELDGGSFESRDVYGHLCVATGLQWTLEGSKFDGTTSKITCPSGGVLLLGNSDFTIILLVYKDTLTANECLISTTGKSRDIRLSGTAGAITIDLQGCATITSNAGLIDTGRFTHIAVVRSGNDCIIYKNGEIFQTSIGGFAGGNNTTVESLIVGYNL